MNELEALRQLEAELSRFEELPDYPFLARAKQLLKAEIQLQSMRLAVAQLGSQLEASR